MRLPVSAHAAALGGENISLIEDDESVDIFTNPCPIVFGLAIRTIQCKLYELHEGHQTSLSAASIKR